MTAARLLAVAACATVTALAWTVSPAETPTAAGATSPAGSGIVVRVLHLVDTSRRIRLPDGRRVPRPLTTFVRYPASGTGPWPLVVFGHGFRVTPGIYAHLLRAWTLAGYVVAAPVFPLGNEYAPGGPDESDIVNQPRDLSFVISRLVEGSSAPGNFLRGLVDPSKIAVAGQSDGAETAFAAAYDRPYRDDRIDAAVVLSGAQLPGVAFAFPTPSPPLLAVQGTADEINPQRYSRALFAAARRPKFLLLLRGAGHLPPYTTEQPQRDVVEAVSVAFLDRYLKHGGLEPLRVAAAMPGVASLVADP